MWWNKKKNYSKLATIQYYDDLSFKDKGGTMYSISFSEDYKGYIRCNNCPSLKDRRFYFDLLDLGNPDMKELHNFFNISKAKILELFIEWRKNETKQTPDT